VYDLDDPELALVAEPLGLLQGRANALANEKAAAVHELK
jgi:hypothetical protein